MSSSSSRTNGPVDRLQGSLRNSAVARLLVEGRLTDKADILVHPPPIDLSTNRNSKQLADGKVSLSTIATMERLRCIIAVEVQGLLTKVGAAPTNDDDDGDDGSSSSSTLFSCRLCPFTVSQQVIELLAHYRYHNDTLGSLALKSPNVLCNWMEFFLKTSSTRLVRPSMSRSVPVTDAPVAGAETGCSSPHLHVDLRSLLLKPFKGTSSTKAPFLLNDDRHCHNPRGFTSASAASSSSSSSVSQKHKQVCQGSQSRSSTPYNLISGLINGDNQQVAEDRSRSSSANYVCERVSIKCEIENSEAMMRSPADRSPQSTYSERSMTKDPRPNSHCSLGLSPEQGSSDHVMVQNGHLSCTSCTEDMAENLSPPQLRRESENSCSPLYNSHTPALLLNRNQFRSEFGVKYVNRFDNHPFPVEGTMRKSSIMRHLYQDARASQVRSFSFGDKSLHGNVCSRENRSPAKHPAPQQIDGHLEDAPSIQAGRLSNSPNFRETIEQEYAYKQYKRFRKRSEPKSCTPNYHHPSPDFQHNSLAQSPDVFGANRTPSSLIDDGVRQAASLVQQQQHQQQQQTKYDVGIQCNIVVRDGCDNWTRVMEGFGDDRCRRKRTFPGDEEDGLTTTTTSSSSLLPDADSCKTTRCSHCGITFDDDVIFSIHMGCHSHTDPFICNICGRHCDNKYTFNTHILRGHHPT